MSNKWLNKLKNKFHVSNRKEIMEDMLALDEMRDLVTVSSAISDAAKKDNKTIDELLNIDIEIALIREESVLYGNAFEAYKSMNDSMQALVMDYAKAHYEYKPRKEEVKSLAISGGGGKGMFYVGALRALEKDGVLDNITTFAGTSAGALTAIPLALGFNSNELMYIVKNTDFNSFLTESKEHGPSKEKCVNIGSDSSVCMVQESYGKKEQVTNSINSLKFFAEMHSPLDGDSHGADFNASGQLTKFLGFKLKTPISTPFTDNYISELMSQLKNEKKIIQKCSEIRDEHNLAIGKEYYSDDDHVLQLILSFMFEHDFIENYFRQIIENKIHEYVDLHDGLEDLVKINPEMKRQTNWGNLTLEELGQLARTKSGKEFGFNDLVISVTRTRIRGDESSAGKLLKQIFQTQGVTVSSVPGEGDDDSLTKAPIKELARMSMAIPGFFESKEYDGMTYVDGGLHHNLPTEYFDKNGFDSTVLSIIPLSGDQIERSHTVYEALSKTPSFKSDRALDVYGHLKGLVAKIGAKAVNMRLHYGNKAYQEMGLKESFRNIIINCKQYGTLDFNPKGNDLYDLNDVSSESYFGIRRRTDSSSSFFDSDYNSAIRFFEYKLMQHHNSNPEFYDEAKLVYEQNIKENNKSFKSKDALRSLQHLVLKTKQVQIERDQSSFGY